MPAQRDHPGIRGKIQYRPQEIRGKRQPILVGQQGRSLAPRVRIPNAENIIQPKTIEGSQFIVEPEFEKKEMSDANRRY